MNIPGPRKQPSVSPPGQVQGQPQIRAQHHFSTRGPTLPINIRGPVPDNFEGHQLQYQPYPRFSQSPSGFPQIGSSPHQAVGHLPQQPQPPQQLQLRSVPSQPQAVTVISPDNSHFHSVYFPTASSGGQQPPNQSQVAVAHSQASTLQLSTQQLVYATGQGQPSFPNPHQGPAQVFPSSHPTSQGQQPNQPPHPTSFPGQQQHPPRFQQPGQAFHPRQRPPTPQQSEVQATPSHPTPQQPQQPLIISQPFTQGSVPHDLNQPSLGTTVPRSGQTPPQSGPTQGIMYSSTNQPQRHPSQGYMARASNMPQNMTRPPRSMNLGNNPQLYQQQVPGMFIQGQIPPQMGQQIIVQQANPNPQMPTVQYQAGARMQQPFQVSSQQQAQPQHVHNFNYSPANAVYIQQGQTQWPQHGQQVRLLAPQTSTVQTNYPPKREKIKIKITDPTTGVDVNLEDMAGGAKSSSTPPQSNTPSTRGTPVTQTNPTPPQSTNANSIAAQFATQVAATLTTDKGQPQPGMQPPPQAGQPQLSQQHQGPPGAPPQPAMLPGQGPVPVGQQIPHQQPQVIATQMMQTRMTAAPQMMAHPSHTKGPMPQHAPHQHPVIPGPAASIQPMVPGSPGAQISIRPQSVPQPQGGATAPATLTQQPTVPQPIVQQQPVQAPPAAPAQSAPAPQQAQAPPPTSAPAATVAPQAPVAATPQPAPAQPQTSVSTPSQPPAPVQEPLVQAQPEKPAQAKPQVEPEQSPPVTEETPAPTEVSSEAAPKAATPTPEATPAAPREPSPKQDVTAAEESPAPAAPSPAEVRAAPSPTTEVQEEASPKEEPASTPTPAPLPQREEGKDRRKKASKPVRSRDFKDKADGSDVDAVADVKNSKESTSRVDTPEPVKTEGAAAGPPKASTPDPTPDKVRVETPPAEEKPPVSTPQDTAPDTAANDDDEQRRVAERNEKNSKEHSKVEETKESSVSENKENHIVEDSNRLDKSEPPVIKKDKMELKYKYREDQWSPLNPEGKKQYDRGFLLQLQYSTESLEKPFGLPPLPDVVLDTPITSRNEKQFGQTQSSNSKGMLDFTPAYVMPNFGGKPPPHKRNSQQKMRGGGGGEPRKVINLQIQEVKLHQTDNAWKPPASTKKDKSDPETEEREELFRKVRGILNKLTPQKFQKLVTQVLDLGINTEEKLAGTIDITFEKAISEPNFSVAYANLCKCLNNVKVPQKQNPEQYVMFRKLLLNRCQKEFERDKADALGLEKMQKEIDEAKTEDKKKELKALKDEAETKARRRSLGNIRFIGELFKLRMLTENIMHDCLLKLLRSQDEDSLEALCNLLKTIGKDLDVDKAKPKVDQYFVQLAKMVEAKKHSSRIRFMMLDVIDLRKNNWVPRREDNNPKTIEQIHREAQEEEQQKQIMLQNMPPQPKNKSRGGGGRGSQSGSHAAQQGEDGWTPVKATRTPAIDPAKMKITKQPLDENIQLGPGGRPGSFGTWGRGSSGGSKQASKDSDRSSAPGNRYSLLSGSGGSDNYDGARLGVGRGGGSMASGGRDSKGGRLSQGRERSDRGKIVSRPSQEQEREAALAAARNITSARSASGSRTPVGSRNQSRDSSRNRVPSSDRSADKKPAATNKQLSLEEVEKKSKSLVDEYLSVHDLKEALQCIRELKSPSTTHMCVNFIILHVLERSDVARKMTSQLLYKAIEQKVILPADYTEGLVAVLEFADDMAIDIPQIWKYLGELVGPMMEHGIWHISNLKPACKVLLPFNKAGVLVAHVLHNAAHRQGHIKVGEMWKASNLKWSDFLVTENQEEFLAKHKLEYTVEAEVPKSPEATTMPVDLIQKQLEVLIIDREADNEVVFDWINANVAESRTREAMFIRALMTAVCTSAIVGQGSSCKVEAERLKKRCILLQRYLDHDAKLELQALYALQALVHKLEHPPEVLRVFFDTLYDEDIISEDAFYQWESSKDPAEVAGKGVAVSSVVQFFTWLREAEEDDPDAASK